MRVKATYLPSSETQEELEKSLILVQDTIKISPENIALYTDDDKLIGISIQAYIEDDHLSIEYECNNIFKEELEKEGFQIL